MGEFIEYETPSSSLKRLTQQDRSEEFKLRIRFGNEGSTFDIRTTVNKIRVISKTINNLYEVDPTTNEYEIHLPARITNSEDIKFLIEQLLKSTEEKVLIEKDKEQEMNVLRLFLGETIKDDNICIELKNIKEAISYLNTEAHSISIEYLSTHFKEFIEEGEIDKLNESIIIEIIDSYFQKEEEEKEEENKEEKEEIFDKLREKENNNIVMHFLLQHKEEEYTEEMKEYIANNLTDEIVSNELSQIIKNYRNIIINMKLTNNKPKNTLNIEYNNDELKGIISYMKQTINKNLIANEELKITSGHRAYSGSLSNLIEYNDKINDYFRNHDGGSRLKESEGWIEFDFGKRKINLTSYTLRTSNEGLNGCYHPKTWRILGSNDKKEWTLLDKQVSNSCLNGQYKHHRFECQPNKDYYQFIRYIQDESWYENREYHIYLTCIEFFGSISL